MVYCIKKVQLVCVLSVLSCFGSASFADAVTSENNWFFGGGVGWSWANLGNSSTSIPAGDGEMDLYTIQTPQSAASFSFEGGYRWSRSAALFPHSSMSLRYQYFNGFSVSGVVDQDSLSGYDNYNYNLNISSNVLNLVGKVDIYQLGAFSPYVSAGVGVAYNRVSNYTEQATSGVMPRVSPGFNSNSTSSFAYSAGVGVDYACNKNVWASLGYEYANLGNANTGNGNTTWSSDSLTLGKLTTSTVALKIFYQPPRA